MDAIFWVWVGVIAVSILVEVFTFQMVTIWFAFGGLAALIMSACNVSEEWQIVVFIIISVALLLGIRKITMRLLNKDTRTNIDALVGKKAVLKTGIMLNKPGEVLFNGIIWSTYTQDSSNIEAGTMIEVVSIDGNKLIVKKDKAVRKDKSGETTKTNKTNEPEKINSTKKEKGEN